MDDSFKNTQSLNVDIKLGWKKEQDFCADLRNLYMGKFKVASVVYDAMRKKGDPKKYAAICLLPGIKSKLGRFETEEEALAKSERAIEIWINRLSEME